jgi:putative hemolysin
MRRGFHSEAINSRGVHFVDPTGKPERELAETYRRKADDVENASYQRFAVTLRNLSVEFDREADRIVADNHGSDDDHG